MKLAWKKAKVKGSNHFQKIIKSNAPLTKRYGISVHNIILPPGLAFPLQNFSLTPQEISLRINPFAEESKDFFQQSFILHILFYFYDPKRKSTIPYSFFGRDNEISFTPDSNTVSRLIGISLNEDAEMLFKKYKQVIIYIAASLSQPGNRKIFWTSTYSSEINFVVVFRLANPAEKYFLQ